MRTYHAKFGRFALVLLTLANVGCGSQEEDEKEKEYYPIVSIQEVRTGLQSAFTVTGEVEANESANITAEFKSTVIDLFVKVGEKVSEGQSLVALKSETVSERYSTANATSTTARQNLEQTKIMAQRSIEQAEVALKTEKINLEEQLKQNTARQTQAEESLNTAKISLSLSIASSETALENTIRTTRTVVQDALTDADALMEFSIQQQSFDYVREIHIGARDPTQKVKAKEAFSEALRLFQSYADLTYQESLFLLGEVEIALMTVLETLQNSTTSPRDYPQSQLNEDIGVINGHLSTIRSTISQLQSAQRTLESTKQQVANGKSQTLVDADATYDMTKAELEASEERARLAVEQAEKALESAKASAKASEIGALSTFTSAAGELDQARINRDDLIIEAPFEGVVAELSLRKGRELQQGDLIIAIENNTLLKVVTSVSADEVRRIKEGDVIGIGDTIKARISSVAPSADPVSKKYKVEIILRDEALQSGEFVTLHFQAMEDSVRDARIFLPVTAVHVSAAETFVWIASEDDNQIVVEKRSITIGEVSGKYVQVVEGISEGDQVIVEGGRNIEKEGTIVKVES